MLGPPVAVVDPGVDAPTERFRPVSPPGAVPASADLPHANHPEEPDGAERQVMAAIETFNTIASMSMAERLVWAFGPPDPREPTPVWDDVVLSAIETPDGDGES